MPNASQGCLRSKIRGMIRALPPTSVFPHHASPLLGKHTPQSPQPSAADTGPFAVFILLPQTRYGRCLPRLQYCQPHSLSKLRYQPSSLPPPRQFPIDRSWVPRPYLAWLGSVCSTSKVCRRPQRYPALVRPRLARIEAGAALQPLRSSTLQVLALLHVQSTTSASVTVEDT